MTFQRHIFVCFFFYHYYKDLRNTSNYLNKAISNETIIIDEVFKLYPQLILTVSANQRFASSMKQSADQIRGNVSEVIQILSQQNTTMALWNQVDILRNRSDEILKIEQNTSQMIDYADEKGTFNNGNELLK